MARRVDPMIARCPKCGSKRNVLCHERGAAFDDEALPSIDAADEWREPNAAETNVVKQLSFQANQRMRGAA